MEKEETHNETTGSGTIEHRRGAVDLFAACCTGRWTCVDGDPQPALWKPHHHFRLQRSSCQRRDLQCHGIAFAWRFGRPADIARPRSGSVVSPDRRAW